MICLIAAGKTTVFAATAFTLAWTHSIEKTRWEEEWQMAGTGLEITAARTKGSGAGIDPPDGAVLRDGWWSWRPDLPVQTQLTLAASGATGEGWTLCAADRCEAFGEAPAQPAVIKRCQE